MPRIHHLLVDGVKHPVIVPQRTIWKALRTTKRRRVKLDTQRPVDTIRLANPKGERVDIHLPMDVSTVAALLTAAANEGFEFEKQEEESK